MAEQAKDAQAEVSKPAAETTVEETPKEQPQETIGEMTDAMIESEKSKGTVASHEFVAVKKALKLAEKELKSLKTSIEQGASKEEITDSISEIAEEHNIDKGFLKKLVSTIKSETEKELEEKFGSKLEQKEKAEKFDTTFSKAFDKAIERTPDFKNIANSEVIKLLAVQPQNSKKTVSQLLEETYGNAIVGKRTLETTSPNGGKEPEKLDYNKAKSDTSYFLEIMKNPKMKAEYNERMLKSGF